MESINRRVCGLDVHEARIVAAVIIDEDGKKRPRKETREFSAMRADIVRLHEWLTELGITAVVMEGTGSTGGPFMKYSRARSICGSSTHVT